MAMRLTKLTTVMIALIMLTTISSCVTSTTSPSDGGKMEVVRQFFPSAIDVVETNQDAQLTGRPGIFKISEIKSDSALLGYSVETKVVSRSGPFRIRVLLDTQLYVKKVTVISYPWDRGRDIRKRAFTDQFKGKGPSDPIKLGKDINAMTGATISSRVMTEGVACSIAIIKKNQSVQ